MEKTPLLHQPTAMTRDQKVPVSSIAVPLGTPASSGHRTRVPAPPTGAAAAATTTTTAAAAAYEPVKFTPHHERNQTDYTWLSSILSRMDSKVSPEHRRRLLSKFFPSNMSPSAKLILFLCYISVIVYTIIIFVAPLILAHRDEAQWCPVHQHHLNSTAGGSGNAAPNNNNNQTKYWVVRHYGVIERVNSEGMAYSNPDYDTNPCRYIRLFPLLGLTLEECDMSRRMVVSVILGGAIGYERRSADRPAGIRTMALVSLGSCVFTVASILAFQSSTMGWDASRVAAALPSGIGFLGGALIWKGTIRDTDGQDRHQVHGLTTAASLWLSAAVGVGAGGALYVVTTYSTILVILVLRYGPKIYEMSSSEAPEEDEGDIPHEVSHHNVATAAAAAVAAEFSIPFDDNDQPMGRQSEHSVRRRRLTSASEGPTFRS